MTTFETKSGGPMPFGRDFQLPGRSSVYASNGMCATSHPLAAKVAIDILESGGNAADAAIAGAVLLGICEPQMTGIGGDCFVLLTPPGGGDVVALNGSGRAPAGLSAADMREAGHAVVPKRGIEAVTIPGAVDAFCALSGRYGRTSLAEVLAPAIRYATEGVPVAPRVAFDWATDVQHLQGAARDFYSRGGEVPWPLGRFAAPGQAEVLRRIAAEGRDGFYRGEVADDMITSLRAMGGSHTAEDFAATACSWSAALSGAYGGLELHEHPPNGQGATAILLLNILKHFDIAELNPWGAKRAHIEAEATKLAYGARNRIIADPDHTTRVAHMLSEETAAKLAALIRPGAVLPASLPGAEEVHRETVYITVVDRDRMTVSLIYSIFSGFGSGLASDTFGILFQNRGSGFTLTEGHPNEAGGGKRPMHTIIPGLLTKDGVAYAPFGVMGGQYQPTGHARFVSNLTDFGLTPQEAIDAPRSFADAGVLKVERGYDPSVRQALSDMGHNVAVPDVPLGGGQAIIIADDGTLIGGSDPRKDGIALGY